MYLKFEKNELKRFEPNSHFLYIRSEQRKFQTVFQLDIFYLNCYFIHEVFNSSPTYVAVYFVSSQISDTQKLDEFYSISSSSLKSISLLEVKPANRWNQQALSKITIQIFSLGFAEIDLINDNHTIKISDDVFICREWLKLCCTGLFVASHFCCQIRFVFLVKVNVCKL